MSSEINQIGEPLDEINQIRGPLDEIGEPLDVGWMS